MIICDFLVLYLSIGLYIIGRALWIGFCSGGETTEKLNFLIKNYPFILLFTVIECIIVWPLII